MLILYVLVAAACGNAIVFAPTTLGFVAPIRGNVAVRFEALEAGVHRGFFEFVLVARVLVDELGDFVAVFIAFGQQFQDNRIRVAAEQIRREFVINHNYSICHITMTVKVILFRYNKTMKITLVTGNVNKLKEWQAIMPSHIELDSVDVDLTEIQSGDPEVIVADKLRRAYEHVGLPVIVEDVDAGLDKLNGLPGPFIKFFNEKLGKDALYKLAGSEGERATVACTAGYYNGTEMIIVRGEVRGTVVAPRGDSFGFDIVFVPEGETLTYAEMSKEKKNSLSHRQKAIRMLVEKIEVL